VSSFRISAGDLSFPVFVFQVFRALENVDVKPETFPMLNSWMNVIAAHPEEERSKWKSVKPIIKQVRHLEGARKLTFED
jgi:hypothetical protein